MKSWRLPKTPWGAYLVTWEAASKDKDPPMQHAIQTPEDFDHALEEAREHLEGLQTAKCVDAEQLDELLRRIAAYHEQNAVVQTDHVQDELRAFDDHLRAYGRHWPTPAERPADHWAPMVGGSVKPQ